MFKHGFVANSLLSLTTKTRWKSVYIWWSHAQQFSVLFFSDSQCTCQSSQNFRACYTWPYLRRVLAAFDMLYNFSLWMTSCLRIMARDRQCEKALCSNWLNREQHGFDTAAYTETDAPGTALVRGGVWYLRLPWACSGVRMWTVPMAYSRYEVWAERIERPKVVRGGSRVQYQSGRKSW